MTDKKLLIRIFSLLLLIFALNFLAMKFYWYSSIWYFDMPMHFLGGFWLGLAFLRFFPLKEVSWNSILGIISGILLVGGLWELFEILVNKSITANPFNTLDTVSDIFFDLAGGLSAIFFFCRKTFSFSEKAV